MKEKFVIAVVLAFGLAVGSVNAQQLINGGFESYPGAGYYDTANGCYDFTSWGWRTSADPNRFDFPPYSNASVEIWSGSPAPYEGSQFAELNFIEFAALYQDVNGIAAGAKLYFEFAHQARNAGVPNGTDTMGVTITDLGPDGVFGGTDDTVLFQKSYTSGYAWNFFTSLGEAPITALGNKVRFSYAAITSSTGNAGIGNFIDAVKFGKDESVVPFAYFLPKLSQNNGQPGFNLAADIGLGGALSGVDPLTEEVTFSLSEGGAPIFTRTIPAGSFVRTSDSTWGFVDKPLTKKAPYGVKVKITQVAPGVFNWDSVVTYFDIDKKKSSVSVTLTIGDDSGTADQVRVR